MAKGDKNKVQQAVNTGVNTSRSAVNDLTNQMIVPTTQGMYNNYQVAANDAHDDYRNLMNQFMNYSQTAPGASSFERVNYSRSPELQAALSGYQNFANTGGFSGQDIADMRARGISPIRAVYSNMQNELARQKNLQGGYAPNMAAAMTRMRGSTSQQIADQVQNVNAAIAEMRQKGQLAGLEGLGNLSVRDLDFGQQAALANQQAGLETNRLNATAPYANPRLAALSAAAQLYGTTPGQANMFGNQLLDAQRNWLAATGQVQNVGQMGINGQMNVASVPSNFETGLGRVGQIAGIAGQVAGGFMGLPGGVTGQSGMGSGLYSSPGYVQPGGNLGGMLPSRNIRF